MSFLGRSSQPTGAVNQERVEMAMQELDMITDVFNKLVSCVSKFFEVNKKVGEKLQGMGANAAATSQSAFGSL
ncbi:hypothetical protein NLI96_g8470 [Meripilus lineatus]|uniref:Uncharacterized protein n=1 Tax=Meripilus lineatus TaxID=2056292 RepID=A0AAD5YDY0_9APHY|nr:hypothetical protein NLI96_g8470 [Physisporinus lineatus]